MPSVICWRSFSPSLSGSSEARRVRSVMAATLHIRGAPFNLPVLRPQLRNPRGHLIHVPPRGTTDLNGLREFAGYDLAVNCGTGKTDEFANRPDIEKLWLQNKNSVHRPTAPCCRLLCFLFSDLGALKRPEQIGYFLDPKSLVSQAPGDEGSCAAGICQSSLFQFLSRSSVR